jgi:conjugal transfer pilus assembly protein TraB
MNNSTQSAISQQKRNLILAFIGGVFLVGGVYYISQDDIPAPKLTVQSEKSIKLPSDGIDFQEVWMGKIESERQVQDKKLQYLEELILDSKKKEEGKERENFTLKKELQDLKKDLASTKTYPPQQLMNSMNAFDDPFIQKFDPAIEIPRLGMNVVEMPKAERSKVLHVDQVIPAGTSVRAILVSSVDASCGVHASADPQPVKLRIIDDGHLPKGVTVKLKGGIVIASSYGDLSSERVLMRIERLTQTIEGGDFIETVATGYITGEDGKYGVRGVVVDKSDKLIQNAAISGFFSGMGQFLTATINAQNIHDATEGCPNNLHWDLLKEGGCTGASSGFDMLSEYYIRRAEQLQPVIQVAAGRVVDITFTHNAEVGDLHTQEKLKKEKQIARKVRGGGDVL